MIKVNKDLDNVPASLNNTTTQRRRNELIEAGRYIHKKKHHSRYKQPDVKARLKKLYRGKCAFCEQCIEQFQVEHFRPKSIYYWLTYSWDNLLAVCPTCNQNKKNRFETANKQLLLANTEDALARIHRLADEYNEREGSQLVHPEKEEVGERFSFSKDGSVRSRDERVAGTILICGLDRNDLRDRRKKVWDDLQRKLNSRLLEYQSGDPDALARIRGLLEEFAKDAENLENEFIAFRRHAVQHFLSKT